MYRYTAANKAQRAADREAQNATAAAARAEAQAAREAESLAVKAEGEGERAALREKVDRERRAAEALTPALPISRSAPSVYTSPAPAAAPAPAPAFAAKPVVVVAAAAEQSDDGWNDWETALALPLLILFWTLTYDRLLDEEED